MIKQPKAEIVKAEQQDGSLSAEIVDRLIASGDCKDLTPSQRTHYYLYRCRSLDIDPASKPFDYINLNGKLVLYCNKGGAEAIRKRHDVSVHVTSRELIGEVYVVTAQAKLPSGREDESTGCVAVASLKGESLANAYMKAETKAKRRVTLSVMGLGMLDESELDGVTGWDKLQGAAIAATMEGNGTVGEKPKREPPQIEIPAIHADVAKRIPQLKDMADKQIGDLSDTELTVALAIVGGHEKAAKAAEWKAYLGALLTAIDLEIGRRFIKEDEAPPPSEEYAP